MVASVNPQASLRLGLRTDSIMRCARARSADGGQLRAQPPAFAVDHVAERAIRVAIKQFFAMRHAARGLRRSFHFLAANVGDDLPDLLIGHAHALPVGPVGRHGGAGNSVADDLKHFCVGVRVLLLRARQIGTAASAVRSQAVAQRAVDAELVLPRLRRFGIARQEDCDRLRALAPIAKSTNRDPCCTPSY